MVVLQLPNTPEWARLANAVANLADGEFVQNTPPGEITVVADEVRLERAALRFVDGFPLRDDVWATMAAGVRQGTVTEHTEARLVVTGTPTGA